MSYLTLAIFFFLTILVVKATILVVNTLFFKIVEGSTKEKSKLGVNLDLPNCPNCGLKVPAIRKPTSMRQALWGGWTCSVCNCEIDKWGKEIQKDSETKNTQKQIKRLEQDFIKPFDEKGRTPVERIFQEKEKSGKNNRNL